MHTEKRIPGCLASLSDKAFWFSKGLLCKGLIIAKTSNPRGFVSPRKRNSWKKTSNQRSYVS